MLEFKVKSRYKITPFLDNLFILGNFCSYLYNNMLIYNENAELEVPEMKEEKIKRKYSNYEFTNKYFNIKKYKIDYQVIKSLYAKSKRGKDYNLFYFLREKTTKKSSVKDISKLLLKNEINRDFVFNQLKESETCAGIINNKTKEVQIISNLSEKRGIKGTNGLDFMALSNDNRLFAIQDDFNFKIFDVEV